MSLAPVHIVIPGEIQPWQRPQQRSFKGGGHVTYTRPDVAAYHGVVRLAAAQIMGDRPPIEDPFLLSVLAVFDPPKGPSKTWRREALAGLQHKKTRPDLDNTIRGAIDALQSIVFKDDNQIIGYQHCAKVFGDRPRLEILVRPIPHGQPFALLFPSPLLAAAEKEYPPLVRSPQPVRDLFAEPTA